MHPRRAVRIAAIAAVLLGPLALRAQSAQQAIEARLKDHPLYLRGQWQPNRLKFDSVGNLLTGAKQSPFTLAGIDVTRVKYKKDHLEIDGDRVGLEFLATGPKRLSLQTGIEVDIAAPPGADFGPALDKIFADGLADLVPSMPPYWQRYAQHLGNHSQTPEIDETRSAPHPVSPGARVTSTVHAPQALAMPEARFTQAARDAKLRGTVTVGFVVKEDGTVTRPYIVRPLGLGLDENAIDAVMQYRFKPAMRDDGTPVPVELMVDVNFQIF